jgi:hypothetical protein
MLARELAQIEDDIDVLTAAGYQVIVDTQGTHQDFLDTVSGDGAGAEGLTPAGFYWSAHGGADGSLQCCDGGLIYPGDVDPEKVPAGLRLAVFGACYVGAHSRTWRRALGGTALVVGWGRPVTIERAVDFLEPDDESTTDLDDLIRRWLLTDATLPVETPRTQVPPAAAAGGRVGLLAERIPLIAQQLSARWQLRDTSVRVEVPLPEGRRHRVDVFLVDALEPFAEGDVLCGMEADVGETSALITPETLLAGEGRPSFARIALVAGETEMPRIVAQSFLSVESATDRQLTAHLYAVAAKADALEHAIFGQDVG